MIIAIDFDGTLVTDKFPEIGDPNIFLIEKAKKWKMDGHKLILWTCREDVYDDSQKFPKRLYLTDAIKFCEKYGLFFDAINKNVDEVSDKKVSRKVYADIYIDDKSCVIDEKTNSFIYNKKNIIWGLE